MSAITVTRFWIAAGPLVSRTAWLRRRFQFNSGKTSGLLWTARWDCRMYAFRIRIAISRRRRQNRDAVAGARSRGVIIDVLPPIDEAKMVDFEWVIWGVSINRTKGFITKTHRKTKGTKSTLVNPSWLLCVFVNFASFVVNLPFWII